MFAELREGQSLIVIGAHFSFDREGASAKIVLNVRPTAGSEAEVKAASKFLWEIAPSSITRSPSTCFKR